MKQANGAQPKGKLASAEAFGAGPRTPHSLAEAVVSVMIDHGKQDISDGRANAHLRSVQTLVNVSRHGDRVGFGRDLTAPAGEAGPDGHQPQCAPAPVTSDAADGSGVPPSPVLLGLVAAIDTYFRTEARDCVEVRNAWPVWCETKRRLGVRD